MSRRKTGVAARTVRNWKTHTEHIFFDRLDREAKVFNTEPVKTAVSKMVRVSSNVVRCKRKAVLV